MVPNYIQKDMNTGSVVKRLRETETETTAEQKQTQTLLWLFFKIFFPPPEVNGLNK